MDLDRALTFAADSTRGYLITIRRNGRPQSSNVVYHLDGGTARISVTADRAKAANLRRDPRASLHVSPDFGRYVVLEATATLTQPSAEIGDDVGRELLEVYESVAGPHPDPDEFLAAMVTDRRLVVRLTVERAYGMLP